MLFNYLARKGILKKIKKIFRFSKLNIKMLRIVIFLSRNCDADILQESSNFIIVSIQLL